MKSGILTVASMLGAMGLATTGWAGTATIPVDASAPNAQLVVQRLQPRMSPIPQPLQHVAACTPGDLPRCAADHHIYTCSPVGLWMFTAERC